MNSRLELNEFEDVQVQANRDRKLDDNPLQSIGSFNGKRHWHRPVYEYLDHREPLEVHKFARR